MILILGGTTEGRICAETIDTEGKTYYYSTRGNEQSIDTRYGIRVTGGMNTEEMCSFCKSNSISLLVDAAHPFAIQLHATVAETSEICDIPVIRFEREYPSATSNEVICNDYNDAVDKLRQYGIKKLLALTGVQTIEKLSGYWKDSSHKCFFRILDRKQSYDLAAKNGFPISDLLVYDDGRSVSQLIEEFSPDAVITKESGITGGYEEKQSACRNAGIPLFVVKHPKLPENFITVTGKHGLRKAIEYLQPDFFHLRSGYTTGSCATAATKAALLSLLGKEVGSEVSFTLPDREEMRMKIHSIVNSGDKATASVIKDAGDDPDVTHGHVIQSTVSFCDDDEIHFLQGEGVGKVTLPGLGIPVGEPAINATPRKMITGEIQKLYKGGINVTICVPDGKVLAKKTFNPKLGIEGGISIIGTSGIVRPFSSEAFVDAIRREAEVAKALNIKKIIINSGAKSEKYVKRLYPELPPQAFIHFGNFIGETLKIGTELEFSEIVLGIMIGKAVKLAAGNLDTHSKKVVMDKEFLKRIAYEAGCSKSAADIIDDITLANELWKNLNTGDGMIFFDRIARLCHSQCMSFCMEYLKSIRSGSKSNEADSDSFPSDSFFRLRLLLIDDEGNIRADIS